MYLVRYAEIALKSEPVRRSWENRLISNIKQQIGEQEITKSRGRIWIHTSENYDEQLSRTFGIQSFSSCDEVSLEDLESKVLNFAKTKLEDENTFALRVRRVGEQSFTSQDVAAELGEKILEQQPQLKVNLDRPEKEIFIEIRDDDCYIFDHITQGLGGLPVGVSGKLVALLSGGIDSPVAIWMMMKRGCHIIPAYIDNAPFTDKNTVQRVLKIVEALQVYQPNLELRVIENTEFMLRLKEVLEKERLDRYTCVLCKRNMYRLGEQIAMQEDAQGLVTGESLGQVASQTMDNLRVLDQTCSIPVYRPLIGLDKLEIEGMAKNIGTYEISISDPGECGAVPDKPATKSDLGKILELEDMVL